MKLNNQITKLATASRCELSVITRAGECHWHAVEMMPAEGGYRQGVGKTAKEAIQLMKLARIVKATN
jgi:hypothetical protein